jgi:putative ABC transport system permease protein
VSPLAGWRPALRLAWRDVLRSRGRTMLVLVMIALPVLAVTAADVVYATSKVSAHEGLDRRIGSSAARLRAFPGQQDIVQWVDPDDGWASSGDGKGPRVTLADAAPVLGDGRPAILLDTGIQRVHTGRGALDVVTTQTVLTDPLARGLFRLDSGRWPTTTDQVVVNAALAEHGFGIGDTVPLRSGDRTVVGIVESTNLRTAPVLAGLPGSVGPVHLGEGGTWLVGGGPVSWDDVRALNKVGFTVLSRDVVDHPPSESQKPAQLRGFGSSGNGQILSILLLVVSMALLEVVLLAGPAFAVGARRQSRTLALMSATGGTPRQARRVILASGMVLGALAAVAGVVVGLGVGWAALPFVQRLSDTWFGPFDLNWLQLVGIAGFGVLSAFLAAVVPAWIASRQDVVAVLAGRRGDRRPSLRSPVLGVLLLGAGIVVSVAGTRGGGTSLIAVAAVVSVVGMIFLVPLVVVGLARVCGRLPLAGRYAVRDAARHRTRTVPAIAAVAATVAGVVALGIANSSDAAQNKADYTPSLQMGTGAVISYSPRPDWAGLTAVAERVVPRAVTTPVLGVPGAGPERAWFVFHGPRDVPLLEYYSSALTSGVVVSDHRIPSVVAGVPTGRVSAAEAMLRRGGVVVFASRPGSAHTVTVTGRVHNGPGRPVHRIARVRLPALYVVPAGAATVEAVMSSSAVERLGATPQTVALGIVGDITKKEQSDLTEAVSGQSRNAHVEVERGYEPDTATRILLLILGVLGGVLMLGGTLTATFLALSDARPDLATLSAVGASPRTRRAVAAAYALVVGFVGAVLGAAVGFIPGIAVTYPLTAPYNTGEPGPSHYLDVPWTLILTLVVGLPLLTALIVGLTARSRLPLVARLD